MHLEFNGETTDSGIKPQNRMRRQDTGIKIPLMSKLKVLREVITNKLFHHWPECIWKNIAMSFAIFWALKMAG